MVVLPAVPTAKAALPVAARDGASCTCRVKACVASGSKELPAVRVKVYSPPLPRDGTPDKVALPSALAPSESHSGLSALTERAACGTARVSTVNVCDPPSAVNTVLAALVNTGGVPTVRSTSAVAALPAELLNTAL